MTATDTRARRRRIAAIALALTAGWWSPAHLSAVSRQTVPVRAGVAAPGCDAVVGPSVDTVDGTDPALKKIGPGGVICLPAGTRPNMRVRNLHGAPGKPITIRNNGGVVTISGATLADGGILVQGSTDLRITGSGSELHCGAEFASGDQRCGIVIDGALKGIKVDTTQGAVGNFEFDYIEVVHTSQTIKTRGITIHPVPGLTVSGIHVHHDHIVETLAEGIYIGSEPHNEPFATLGKVRNVEIDHNLVERSGYDGIKVKVGIEAVSVHDNLVRDAGQLGDSAHQGGIKSAFSQGDFYNNTVLGGVEGIRMDRVLPHATNRYFNNLLVGPSAVGIQTAQDGAAIFNNTIVNTPGVGIKATGAASNVADNIIAGAAHPLAIRDGKTLRNLIVATDKVGFVDPTGGDYHLTPLSPAVDAGATTGILPCGTDDAHKPRRAPLEQALGFDHDGLGRPGGCRSDLGAFERVRGVSGQRAPRSCRHPDPATTPA